MNGSILRWLPIVGYLSVICILLFLGQFLIAIPFLIPLLQQLDPFFGKKEESKENQRKEVQRKLTEIYSPIHYMILSVRQHLYLGDANGAGFVGGQLPIAYLDNYEQVRQIFIDHGHELGQDTVQRWMRQFQLNIVTTIPIIYVNTDFGALLRELDAEFQRLDNRLKELSQ